MAHTSASRDARAFDRWAAELSPDWPVELQLLAGRALLSLKQMDQPRAERQSGRLRKMEPKYTVETENDGRGWSWIVYPDGTREGPIRYTADAHEWAEEMNNGKPPPRKMLIASKGKT